MVIIFLAFKKMKIHAIKRIKRNFETIFKNFKELERSRNQLETFLGTNSTILMERSTKKMNYFGRRVISDVVEHVLTFLVDGVQFGAFF